MSAPDLVFRVSGWRDSNPRPLRPELRAERSIGVVSARRGPLAGVLGRCWSASLLYFAAVQQPVRSWRRERPGSARVD